MRNLIFVCPIENEMKRRLLFLLIYAAGWLALFILFRAIFLIYQHQQLAPLSAADIFGAFYHGFSLDLSATAYLCVIPFLFITLTSILAPHWVRPLMKGYTYFMITIVCLVQTSDLEVFRAWGFHLDSTPLMYLKTPKEMVASSLSSPLWLLFLIFFVLSFIVARLFGTWIDRSFEAMASSKLYWVPLYLLITAALIIPIRGGFQLAPINQSSVYFSSEPFANQAAINPLWNFLFSIVEENKAEAKNPYDAIPLKKAEYIVQKMYAKDTLAPTPSLLKVKKPNVIIIVWESFTAKVVKALGGKEGVTPRFNQLIHEGILFDHAYATGARSDKGLAGILSGYPAQPTESIINIPDKSRHMAGLPNTLRQYGYNTAYYYGGEIAFFNMKSYMLNIGFQQLVSKKDFAEKDMNSKWGAHDGVVLTRLANDLKTVQQPFFRTIFTLSSHEPFEVPMKTKIPGNDEEHEFMNALYYTDSSIYQFIQKIKQEPWYNNTLIVIVADHGHRMPDNSRHDVPNKFHIPILWLGGALAKQDTVIHSITSQTDIAATLLNQLNMPDTAYHWSKDALNPGTKHFAQCHFNDGSLLMSPAGALAYDEKGKKITYQKTYKPDSLKRLTIAHLEASFQDYLNK